MVAAGGIKPLKNGVTTADGNGMGICQTCQGSGYVTREKLMQATSKDGKTSVGTTVQVREACPGGCVNGKTGEGK